MKVAAAGAFVIAFALHAAPARAHAVGVSRGEYRVAGPAVEADLAFASTELASAFPALDRDGDGALAAAEVSGARPLLTEAIVNALEVRTPSGPCRATLEDARLAEADGLTIRAAYRCAGAGTAVSLRVGFLAALSIGHRHLATVAPASGEAVRAVLYESRPALDLAASRAGAGEAVTRAVAWPLFRLGVHHILTGYDHLVFLLALVLVGGRLRPLLVVVTAFTAAHSLTLGMAVLGVWAPSPRAVEPAIALSIAYVGVENWFVRSAERRWLLTFPFGLVHGFGFAGALGEVSLPARDVPLALAAFNVGVEIGQLAVLAVVLPLVLRLGKTRWFPDHGVKALSAAVAVAGFSWFLGRLG
jgi:hydrogenase/urease accessory protein HupE